MKETEILFLGDKAVFFFPVSDFLKSDSLKHFLGHLKMLDYLVSIFQREISTQYNRCRKVRLDNLEHPSNLEFAEIDNRGYENEY